MCSRRRARPLDEPVAPLAFDHDEPARFAPSDDTGID